MTMSGIPVQSGGAIVLGAAAVKSGSQAIAGLPATGAHAVQQLAGYAHLAVLAGATMLAGAAVLLRGGRRSRITAGEEMTSQR